jgi:hypothetical protein
LLRAEAVKDAIRRAADKTNIFKDTFAFMAILVLSYTFICLLMYQFYAANLHINLIFMHFGE